MSIKATFVIGYSVTALLFGILGVIILLGSFQVVSKIKDIEQTKIPVVIVVDQMYEELLESIPEAYSYTTYADSKNKVNFEEKMTSYDGREAELRQLAKIGQFGEITGEKELILGLHNAKEDYKKTAETMFAFFEKTHKLQKSDLDNFDAKAQAMHAALDKVYVFGRKNLETASSGVDQKIGDIGVLIAIIALFVGIFAGGIALFMLRSISRPLTALADSVAAITNGDLKGRARVVGKNEIGKLAENFNVMADRVEKSQEELKGENMTLERQSLKLNEQLEQLVKFQKVTVDRELKMIELKKELQALRGSQKKESTKKPE